MLFYSAGIKFKYNEESFLLRASELTKKFVDILSSKNYLSQLNQFVRTSPSIRELRSREKNWETDRVLVPIKTSWTNVRTCRKRTRWFLTKKATNPQYYRQTNFISANRSDPFFLWSSRPQVFLVFSLFSFFRKDSQRT